MDAPLGDGARVLGGLLQLGAEPAHLRVLQPRVPRGVPEDVAELLARVAAVVPAVAASPPPVRALAQRHGHADHRGVLRRPATTLQQRVQQQRVRGGALHEPGRRHYSAAPDQRLRRQRAGRRQIARHRTERAVKTVLP